MKSLLVLLSFCFLSLAVEAKSPRQELREIAHRVEQNCDFSKSRVYCQGNFSARSWGLSRIEKQERYSSLLTKSQELAEVWGDTILEGPYELIGDVKLSRIVEIRENEKIILYRVSYFAAALDLESCLNVKDTTEKLLTCQRGKIVETSYLNFELSVSAITNDHARFIPVGL